MILLLLASLCGASDTIDLNTATADQLVAIPGLGPIRAEALVAWRETHAAFSELPQVTQVQGIGLATVMVLTDYVHVSASDKHATNATAVDINSADATAIAQLVEIPQPVAERIVQDRQRHGPFIGCHDLIRVVGVGRATVASLSDDCVAR